jgi:hypothetical protein
VSTFMMAVTFASVGAAALAAVVTYAVVSR